jgi:hypothetical protein
MMTGDKPLNWALNIVMLSAQQEFWDLDFGTTKVLISNDLGVRQCRCRVLR